ncbi:ATP-binding protein [Reyranella sp.]|uniref:ATP-binding protein n=1 Tax=Reyranella sp. TaxID=1929291 RepID=UPI003BABBE6A
MRRLLKLRTWKLRSTTAAETAMVLAVATLAVPLLLFAGAAWLAHGETWAQAEERLGRTLDLLYTNVRASFEIDYLIAANVMDQLEDDSNASIRAKEQEVHLRLKRLVERLPQIEDVWVLDDQGRPLVAANLFPAPGEKVFSDRAYFGAHRDDGRQRFVSEPLRGRGKEIDFFQYSERRQGQDGAFSGVVVVSMSPRYFIDRFAQAADADKFTTSIVRADGEILVRYPVEEGTGRLAANTGFMRSIADRPESGRYVTQASGVDGVPRLFMYRKLPDLPIYVASGYSLQSIRDEWIGRMSSHLIFGIPATLALFGLAVLASRRAMQQTDALLQLREEQLRRQGAEESLRQSQKMNAVGQLTAGIAHDFNNLLTGIGGAVEMMGRRVAQPSADFNRFLELAQAGVSRAATLTQRLLAFSRQQPLQIDVIDVNKLVAGMSELLRRTLGERVRVETVLAGGLWRAKADAIQLESAILNLAINGRDAMPEGGALTIETANAHLDDAYAAANAEVTAGQYVLIAVSDTGNGMDQETIARAFEPFFTTKQRGQGTGLGLSMTFGYIKQVGGHLKIYSEPGHGTVVKIYVPRALEEAPPEPEAARPPARDAGSGPVVLVVEDDAVVRDFAISACREIGCTVYQAGDAPAALAILQAHDDVQLLFTDVGLPGDMNGRQLASAATVLRPDLKVLFTTGYTANAIVHHGVLDAGVNFIGKPFSIPALAAKFKSMGF